MLSTAQYGYSQPGTSQKPAKTWSYPRSGLRLTTCWLPTASLDLGSSLREAPRGGPSIPCSGYRLQSSQPISALSDYQQRDGRGLSWRGGQERAPCLVSSSPYHRTRLDVPGPVSLSQLDLRPEKHGGQERHTALDSAHEVLTRAPRVSDFRLCGSSRRQAPSAFQLLFYNLRGPAGWVGYR